MVYTGRVEKRMSSLRLEISIIIGLVKKNVGTLEEFMLLVEKVRR